MESSIKERVEMIRERIVPNGYKETKVGIIPEDWEVKKLGEISEFKQGFQIKSSNQIDFFKEGYKRYLYINDFFTNRNVVYVKNKKTYYSINKDDICIANTGNTGGESFKGSEGILSNNMFKIFNKEDIILNRYLWYFLKSSYYWNQLYRLFNSGGQPHVGHKNMSLIELKLPPLQEQEKIADILSTWDKAIEKTEKLIEEKEIQKKGLMQELLTGKTRLPGFSGEWKEVKLGNLGKTFNGLSGKTKDDFSEGYKFITYTNIFKNPNINLNVYDLVKLKPEEKQNKIKYGDIFFTTSSETPDEVGMSSVLTDKIEEDIYLNSFCFGFRLNDFFTLLPEYAKFYFREDSFRSKIFKLAQGSTRFNLSKVEILKLKLNLPPLPEQKAIAEILSTADKEIVLLKELLSNKKEEKKGLMQVLLTGIVRV